MAIGHAALADVITDLVADFERNAPDHTFTLDIGHLRHGYRMAISFLVARSSRARSFGDLNPRSFSHANLPGS